MQILCAKWFVKIFLNKTAFSEYYLATVIKIWNFASTFQLLFCFNLHLNKEIANFLFRKIYRRNKLLNMTWLIGVVVKQVFLNFKSKGIFWDFKQTRFPRGACQPCPGQYKNALFTLLKLSPSDKTKLFESFMKMCLKFIFL